MWIAEINLQQTPGPYHRLRQYHTLIQLGAVSALRHRPAAAGGGSSTSKPSLALRGDQAPGPDRGGAAIEVAGSKIGVSGAILQQW